MSTQNKTCSLTYWLINWLTAPRSSCSRWYHHRHPDLPSERIHCQSEKQTSGEGTVSLFFVHFLSLNVLSIWRNSSGVLWQTTVQSWTPFFFLSGGSDEVHGQSDQTDEWDPERHEDPEVLCLGGSFPASRWRPERRRTGCPEEISDPSFRLSSFLQLLILPGESHTCLLR